MVYVVRLVHVNFDGITIAFFTCASNQFAVQNCTRWRKLFGFHFFSFENSNETDFQCNLWHFFPFNICGFSCMRTHFFAILCKCFIKIAVNLISTRLLDMKYNYSTMPSLSHHVVGAAISLGISRDFWFSSFSFLSFLSLFFLFFLRKTHKAVQRIRLNIFSAKTNQCHERFTSTYLDIPWLKNSPFE